MPGGYVSYKGARARDREQENKKRGRCNADKGGRSVEWNDEDGV